MKGWHLLVTMALCCGVIAVVFLIILPFIAAGPTYIAADGMQPPSVIGGQVHHLTEQDFTNHPVLEELIKKHKRVIVPASPVNFLLGFFGGPAYSWMPISDEEEQDLITEYSSDLEFEGTYYQIDYFAPRKKSAG